MIAILAQATAPCDYLGGKGRAYRRHAVRLFFPGEKRLDLRKKEYQSLDTTGGYMPIPFVPPRGRILICNFDMARIHPEMTKQRRVVVFSPRSYNRRHGQGPGRCLVIPFSATAPLQVTPAHVPFGADQYACLTEPTWALCDAITCVSHARLENVQIGGVNQMESLSEDDMARIAVGTKHALGIA
jgi:uncharacterized protein YifN (PemK superfamily)